MKLYDDKLAPNPRRVRIFLAEKGIEVPVAPVNIAERENLTEAFRLKNPLGAVPVLELDDGMYLSESVAICRYFEETHLTPPLMGVDAFDKALVEMWQRRVELEIYLNAALCFQNTHAWWKGRIEQVPEFGELRRARVLERLAWLDAELKDRPFIAGERFTIADITALVAIDFARISKIRIAPEQANLARWYAEVSARPSAKA